MPSATQSHGQKVAWVGGGEGQLELAPELSMREGFNYVYVSAVDNDGVLTRERFVIRGEAVSSVDAVETDALSPSN